jgi:hypothetical protein
MLVVTDVLLHEDRDLARGRMVAPEQLDTPTAALRVALDRHRAISASSEELVARLKIVARAFNKPRRIRVSIEGRDLVTLTVLPNVGGISRQVRPRDPPHGDRAGELDDRRCRSWRPATAEPQVFRIELVATSNP